MTDEVAALVLRDNYEQATALGNAVTQAHSLLPVHRRLLLALEASGALNRELEALPTDTELAARYDAGTGLTAPEFAVLLAYVKIILESEVLADVLVDEPWTSRRARPRTSRRRCASGSAARMSGHRLRREIIATSLVNEVVNRGGTSFVFRAMEESGASAADVIRAYVVVREALRSARPVGGRRGAGQPGRRPRPRRRSTSSRGGCSTGRCAGWSAPGDRRSTWPVRSPGCGPASPRCCRNCRRCWSGPSGESMSAHVETLVERGVPADLALAVDRVVYGFGLLDILETADDHGPGSGRSGPRLLRAFLSVPHRCRSCPNFEAAAQRPVADAGPHGAALRPLLRAGRADRRGAAVHSAGRGAGGPGVGVGAGQRRVDRPGGQRHGGHRRHSRPTWPRCRCCSARSARWSRRRPPGEGQVDVLRDGRGEAVGSAHLGLMTLAVQEQPALRLMIQGTRRASAGTPKGYRVEGMDRLIELEIGGMTCAACAHRIEKKLNRLDGVTASVNYATEKARVHALDAVSADDLIAVVEKTGYTAAVTAPPARSGRNRLVISAVLSLPVVVLGMVPAAQFAGGHWLLAVAQLQWLSLALASVVVGYGGWPFHRSAFRGLRHGAATMDTLVSLGTLAAYGWSVWVLVFGGSHEIYLEAAAAVTTFLLAGRYLEARAKRRAGDALRALLERGAKTVSVRQGEHLSPTGRSSTCGSATSSRCARGRRSPPTAWSIDGASAVDASLLTGESVPVEVRPGDLVTGATVNAGGRLVVRATRIGARNPAGPDGPVGRGRPGGQGPGATAGRPDLRRVRAGGDRTGAGHARGLAGHRPRRHRGVHRRRGRADHRLPVRAGLGHADRAAGRHRPRRAARHPDPGRGGDGVDPSGGHHRARQDRHGDLGKHDRGGGGRRRSGAAPGGGGGGRVRASAGPGDRIFLRRRAAGRRLPRLRRGRRLRPGRGPAGLGRPGCAGRRGSGSELGRGFRRRCGRRSPGPGRPGTPDQRVRRRRASAAGSDADPGDRRRAAGGRCRWRRRSE